MSGTRKIFVVSDGTGETAEKVARATLLQFADAKVDVRVFSRVLTEDDVRSVLGLATSQQAFVLYTLVNPEMRDLLGTLANEKRIETADVIGALVTRMSNFLAQKPLLEPGIGHRLDDAYFKRIEAVEFAVKNDDGQDANSFFKADVVLVGLSRTSKTPLSMYLAHKGVKVANLPLVPSIDPPTEINSVDPRRVFALTVSLDALVKIRRARLRHLGLPESADYATRESVAAELRWVEEFYQRHPEWKCFDVTNRAIEETAAEILRVYNTHFADNATA